MGLIFLIYKLTFSSGKSYIGLTVRLLRTRINAHRAAAMRGSDLPVHCAWRLYGEPFVETLFAAESMSALNAAEVRFIAEAGTLSPGGYNVAIGGDAAASKSVVAAEKIRMKATGRACPEHVKEKLRAASQKKWADEEYRLKVAAGVARSYTPERRAEISVRVRSYPQRIVSPETRERMSLSARAMTDETRAKMSKAAKERVRNSRPEETRKKIAEKAKEFWANPENRAKRALEIREGFARKQSQQIAAEANSL